MAENSQHIPVFEGRGRSSRWRSWRSRSDVNIAVDRAAIVVLASASAALMLIHEFTASLLVRSANTEVMGTVLYSEWTGGSYPRVAVISLAMVAITAVGVAIVAALGSKSTVQAGLGGGHV